ncbi:RecT family recombinase [Oceanobacillus damuensis]|uniref:RecT family recombinase n=1 Tax=Oceanobacillus damuensis TaxID=937928 RepID=UPI0008364F3F|nr:RecT family recombinase [Oceanobacillus damuensis]
MEKSIQFSNEEKSLIWNRFIEPANGTKEEAQHFVEVCETFGLNPLLGDIVFQRYETKRGAKTQFITTRDGLLRVATSQPGYVGPPNANVVKEGDEFEFLPSEGDVKHKFGTKRGKIIGAYAIMKHKKHNAVAVFVDFAEYYNANSGKLNSKYGNANVWDTLPSAMIVKIAETFVLRRQFPLGGLYTQEEIGLDESIKNVEAGPINDPVQQQQDANEGQSTKQPVIEEQATDETLSPFQEMVVKGFEIKTSSKNVPYGLLTVQDKKDAKTVKILVKQENLIDSLKQIPEGKTLNLAFYEENNFYFLKEFQLPESQTDKQDSNQKERQQENLKEEPQPNLIDQVHEVEIQKVEFGQKASGKFAKIAGTIKGEPVLIIARGEEAMKKAEGFSQGANVTLALNKENGFLFLVDVVKTNKQAG